MLQESYDWFAKAGTEELEQDRSPHRSPLAQRALEESRRQHIDVLIVDTAGRLAIDEAMMEEIRKVERGEWEQGNNPLAHAPHTGDRVVSTTARAPSTGRDSPTEFAFPDPGLTREEWQDQRTRVWLSARERAVLHAPHRGSNLASLAVSVETAVGLVRAVVGEPLHELAELDSAPQRFHVALQRLVHADEPAPGGGVRDQRLETGEVGVQQRGQRRTVLAARGGLIDRKDLANPSAIHAPGVVRDSVATSMVCSPPVSRTR